MKVFSASGRRAAVCVLLAFACASCGKKPAAKTKAPKKEAAATHASGERQALNSVSRLLRELASTPPDPSSTPAARAAVMLSKLRSVPVATLSESLRPHWQEMTTVLEAAAQSNAPDISAPLRQRGEAAANALNAALAAEGLTDFRF